MHDIPGLSRYLQRGTFNISPYPFSLSTLFFLCRTFFRTRTSFDFPRSSLQTRFFVSRAYKLARSLARALGRLVCVAKTGGASSSSSSPSPSSSLDADYIEEKKNERGTVASILSTPRYIASSRRGSSRSAEAVRLEFMIFESTGIVVRNEWPVISVAVCSADLSIWGGERE